MLCRLLAANRLLSPIKMCIRDRVYDILLVHDNVANFMHIVGGLRCV